MNVSLKIRYQLNDIAWTLISDYLTPKLFFSSMVLKYQLVYVFYIILHLRETIWFHKPMKHVYKALEKLHLNHKRIQRDKRGFQKVPSNLQSLFLASSVEAQSKRWKMALKVILFNVSILEMMKLRFEQWQDFPNVVQVTCGRASPGCLLLWKDRKAENNLLVAWNEHNLK